jgi:tetratricopeptide (TPR) repeat protein
VNDEFKYKAYISYSHCDERWASWLHRALEAYRVPHKLVGTKTGVGEVPSRIKPVFRDRDDLSSASDLGGTVRQALTDAENMIVICSPDAAASHWVNEEIRGFASLGREKQIFCIIVDGEPGGIGAASTCFPVALTEIGLQEPLAADIRKWADGKHLSKLKLVSGMLGLPLDQLRRRDLQKRQRVWAMTAMASVAIVAVLVVAITARIAAQGRRESGESLVVYKLNELRTMLNVTGDPENLGRLKRWSQQELDTLIDSAGSGENALVNYALELRNQGEDLYRKGVLADALKKHQQSWALLAESYRRDRKNQAVFFELGQADFYIGQILTNQGEIDKAEAAFMSYAEITRRLILLQPENAEWVLEMAYALTNLGVSQQERDANNPERSLQLIQSALEYNQIALVLDPQNENYQLELGQSHAFLADAQRGVCDLEGALQSRKKNVELERDMLERDSEDVGKMRRLGWALSGLSIVQQEVGLTDDSKASMQETLQLMEQVLLDNPDSVYAIRYILNRKLRLALLEALDGDTDHSWLAMDELDEQWQLFRQGDGMAEFTIVQYATFLLGRAWLAQTRGETDMAIQLNGDATTILTDGLRKLSQSRELESLLVLAVFRNWEFKSEMPSQVILSMLPDYGISNGRTRACLDASLAVRQAIMLGDTVRAGKLTAYLLGKGYRDVDFMRVCKTYSLCDRQ